MHLIVLLIIVLVVYGIGYTIISFLNWVSPSLDDPLGHYPPAVRAYLEREKAKRESAG